MTDGRSKDGGGSDGNKLATYAELIRIECVCLIRVKSDSSSSIRPVGWKW